MKTDEDDLDDLASSSFAFASIGALQGGEANGWASGEAEGEAEARAGRKMRPGVTPGVGRELRPGLGGDII